VGQLSPVGLQREQADRKDDQTQAQQTGDVLHDGKRTRQITIQIAKAATGTHSSGPTSVASCRASATPPISAVTVIKLMKKDAPRFAAAMRGPRRSRMISKVARPLTAATRPAICAYRQIPITPTTTTQAKASPNRDPTTALVTRSPVRSRLVASVAGLMRYG